MRREERSFSRSETGVSEVLGFLMSIGISFVILVFSLYAFQIISAGAREQAAEVELKDVASRVLLAVQEAHLVGAARAGSSEIATSTILRHQRVLDVPQNLQGWAYRVSIDANFVNATVPDLGLLEDLATLNLKQDLPTGACTAAHSVCQVSGSVLGSSGKLSITYFYDASAGPTNKITLE